MGDASKPSLRRRLLAWFASVSGLVLSAVFATILIGTVLPWLNPRAKPVSWGFLEWLALLMIPCGLTIAYLSLWSIASVGASATLEVTAEGVSLLTGSGPGRFRAWNDLAWGFYVEDSSRRPIEAGGPEIVVQILGTFQRARMAQPTLERLVREASSHGLPAVVTTTLSTQAGRTWDTVVIRLGPRPRSTR